MSLSEVDISGDDSQKGLLPLSNLSEKPELESFSCLAVEAETGVELLRRMLPSDNDLLKIDLKTKFQCYK